MFKLAPYGSFDRRDVFIQLVGCAQLVFNSHRRCSRLSLQHLIVLIQNNPLLLSQQSRCCGKDDCLIETEAGHCDILRDVPQHSERNHSSLGWRHFNPDFKTADSSSF
jgi:hypothetical protein